MTDYSSTIKDLLRPALIFDPSTFDFAPVIEIYKSWVPKTIFQDSAMDLMSELWQKHRITRAIWNEGGMHQMVLALIGSEECNRLVDEGIRAHVRATAAHKEREAARNAAKYFLDESMIKNL